MARPTLRHSRKFRQLARLLDSPALAWGHLELLWHVCYDQCDDLIGMADDVEEAMCWRGPKGAGVAMLEESGFIDRTPDGYRVHDLWDHCPDYVQKRRKREDERKARNRPPSVQSNGVQTADTRTPDSGTNGSTPSPSPARTPTPNTQHAAAPRRRPPSLVQRRDPSSPFDWDIAVPAKWHADHVRREASRHKGDLVAAEAALLDWYSTVADEWNDRELPSDNNFQFWDRRYQEWRPASTVQHDARADVAAARAAFVTGRSMAS